MSDQVKALNLSKLELESIDSFDSEPVKASSGIGFLAEYPLVGGGEKTNDYCGNFSSRYVCDRVDLHEAIGKQIGKDYAGKAFVRKVHFSCDKPSCPVCYRHGWVIREARKMEARLVEGSKQLGLDVEHIFVSINPKDYGISDEKVLRAMALKALDELGVIAGGAIFHGSRRRRYEHIAGGAFRQFGTNWKPHYHDLGFIRGGYKCRDCKRKNDCLEGCGGFDDRRWQYFLKTGVYVKVVLAKRKSIFSTAKYQLNHSSIKRGATRSHVVTWHGALSYRKMKVKVVKKAFDCPICKSPLKEMDYSGKKHFVLNRYAFGYVQDSMEDLFEGRRRVYNDSPKRVFGRGSAGGKHEYGSLFGYDA